MPEMSKGRGVLMQRYHDGGLSDAKIITLAEGLSWKSGERTRTATDTPRYTSPLEGRGRSTALAVGWGASGASPPSYPPPQGGRD
jgi:hypothetical protein